MNYNSNQHLWLLRGYGVEVDGESSQVNTTPTLAREFRYEGGGRQRYFSRARDPVTFAPLDDTQGWREYLGESIYAELLVTQDEETGAVDSTVNRRYLHAGDGRLVAWKDAGGDWQIVHADHLGSTRLVTGAAGAIGSRLGYSAFGEVLTNWNAGGSAGDAARSRYGYCGGWGYEDDGLADPANSALQTGLLHVGARHYAPGLGRFVQRDPVGAEAGFNCYLYAAASPIVLVDPAGHENLPSLNVGAAVANVIISMNAGMAAVVYNYVRTQGLSTGNATLDHAMDFGVYTTLGALSAGPWVGGPRFVVECGKIVFRGLTGFGR